MTLAEAARPTDESGPRRPADPLPPKLRVAAWFASHYGLAFSPAAVTSRLPADTNVATLHGLELALAAMALKTRRVDIALRRLDPAVLPCVGTDRRNNLIVVIDYRLRDGTATIFDPARDEVRELRPRELDKLLHGPLLLVTPEEDRQRVLLGDREEPASKGHWFWQPVRQNWTIWLQVGVASCLVNLLALALPLFVMSVYDRVIPALSFISLWTLASGVAIAIILDLFLRVLRNAMLETISRRVDMQVAGRLFRRALDIRMLERRVGAAGLASKIREYEAVREFFASSSFVSFVDFIFVGIFVAVMFAIVGPLAWVPVAAIVLVLALALAAQIPISRSADSAVRVAAARNVVLVESLTGVESLKTLNAEPVMQKEWQAAIAASARLNARTRRWSNFITSATIMIQQFVSVGIIVLGVYMVAEGNITIGGLIAANILAGRALVPLNMIAQTLFKAQYAGKALRSLDEVMMLPADGQGPVRSNLQVTRGDLSISGLTFTYPGSNAPAISDLSLDIRPGESVALLGRVGSGKTTLGKLICGLIQAQTGTILVDRFEVAHFDPAVLREGIGYLPQNPQFFTGTLKENLLIGRPDASQSDIDMAMHLSGLSDFVSRLPAGFDHFVGEQGRNLSGGQIQALGLARLLIRKPRLLFLDEPTNAMDQEMEANVAHRLRNDFKTDATLILCTHRNTLAEVADRFVILDAGRKVMDGPREEVMRRLTGNRVAKRQDEAR